MSWLDSLFGPGIRQFAVNGVVLPTEKVLNWVGGVTGVDNPALGRTDVTPGGGPTRKSGTYTAQASDIIIYASGTTWTLTLYGAPVDGQEITVKVTTATTALTVNGNTGQLVENPANPGTYSGAGGGWLLPAGVSVTWRWGANESTWFVA